LPILKLTPEMIGPERTRLTLAYIEGVMLWPHEDEQRAEAYKAARAIRIQEIASQQPGKDINLSASDFCSFMGHLFTMRRPDDIKSDSAKRYSRGVASGLILAETLIDQRAGNKRGLQAVKHNIIDRLRGQPDFEHLSPATVEKTWELYKPVSPFWAAHLLDPDSPFPCRLENLPRFLATAESLRLDAESCHLRQGKELLPPGIAWSVPTDLSLPASRWRPGAPARPLR
jgi:hypothetical protein